VAVARIACRHCGKRGSECGPDTPRSVRAIAPGRHSRIAGSPAGGRRKM
jgi:hypothetical protein